MKKTYEHLSAGERATVMLMPLRGAACAPSPAAWGRSASTVSREWARNAAASQPYAVRCAGQRAQRLRRKHRRTPKLAAHTVLFGVVEHFLHEG